MKDSRAVVVRVAVAAAATALLGACAPPPQAPADGVPETAISVTDGACVPNEVTVKAGRNRFVISNRSMRPLEWEILDGVMVVDERENIVPGLVQKLTTTLKPGTYVMTCGLLTNPRGTLVVTENADAPKTGPTPLEFVSAQAEYRVFVHERNTAMHAQLAAFAAALREGDLERARTLYAPSRVAWQQLAPAAVLASAQYDRLEGSAALYGGGESDPAFVGWHRIEAALFGNADRGTLALLATSLEADAKALGEALQTAKPDAGAILKGASLASRRIADRKLKGLDNPHAGTDLEDAGNNLVGLRRVVELFSRALSEHAPEQLASMQAHLDALQAALPADGSRTGEVDRVRLAAEAEALAGDFDATLQHLGL